MDQWHSARAQSSPDSLRCSSDASRQVAAGMECRLASLTLHAVTLEGCAVAMKAARRLKLWLLCVQFVIIINSLSWLRLQC